MENLSLCKMREEKWDCCAVIEALGLERTLRSLSSNPPRWGRNAMRLEKHRMSCTEGNKIWMMKRREQLLEQVGEESQAVRC